jgi:hypothetical protein
MLLLEVATAPAEAAAPSAATIVDLNGIVTVEAAEGAAPQPAQRGAMLAEGATLRTSGDAKVRLRLADGSIVTLGAGTSLKLTSLARGGTLLDLAEGYLSAIVAKLHPASRLEVRSPSMVAAVRGTTWMEHVAAGATEIFVVEGAVATRGMEQGAPFQRTLQTGEGTTQVAGEGPRPVTRWSPERVERLSAMLRMP